MEVGEFDLLIALSQYELFVDSVEMFCLHQSNENSMTP